MAKVSVVGAAGTVGAAAGYNLALRDVADEIVFVLLVGDVDEDEFVGDVTEGDAVARSGTDSTGRTDNAYLCHTG